MALALLRRLQRTRRPDLSIVAMSATLDAGPVARLPRRARSAVGGAAIPARDRVHSALRRGPRRTGGRRPRTPGRARRRGPRPRVSAGRRRDPPRPHRLRRSGAPPRLGRVSAARRSAARGAGPRRGSLPPTQNHPLHQRGGKLHHHRRHRRRDRQRPRARRRTLAMVGPADAAGRAHQPGLRRPARRTRRAHRPRHRHPALSAGRFRPPPGPRHSRGGARRSRACGPDARSHGNRRPDRARLAGFARPSRYRARRRTPAAAGRRRSAGQGDGALSSASPPGPPDRRIAAARRGGRWLHRRRDPQRGPAPARRTGARIALRRPRPDGSGMGAAHRADRTPGAAHRQPAEAARPR